MATKKPSETIIIPPINIQDMRVRIIGTTPLLIHKFSEKAKRQILETQIGATKKKEWRSPMRDFIEALYWHNLEPEFNYDEFKDLQFEQRENALAGKFEDYIKQGATFGFPSIGLKKAMASGGYRSKVTKDKVSMYSAIFIQGENIEIISAPPEMREDTVRLSNGSADLRYRPFFKEWESVVDISYNADVITAGQILNLLNIAGFGVGIGENRPEKGGQFGMFRVA